jgi:hypothetical protein
MANLWKQGVLGGLALVAGLGIQGCTDDETGLYIDGVMAVIAPQCTVRADPGGTQLLGGTLDITVRPTYDAVLLVGNQFTPRGDKQNLRAETMVVTVTGAVVRLFDALGTAVSEFSVPATGVIQPDSGAEPGFGNVDVTLIPGAEVERLLDPANGELPPGSLNSITRVARVSVFGSTIGGNEVESSEFTYVINVCRGCLDCGTDINGNALVDTACRSGQDGAICELPE